MKRTKPFVVALLAIVALLVVAGAVSLLLVASGEVIVLRTGREAGGEFLARLWVVDHEGLPWIGELDAPAAEWVGRLREGPEVELVRGGAAECRNAVFVLDPDSRALVHSMFLEKYRVPLTGARLLGLLRGGNPDPEASAGSAVLIRLEPCDRTTSGSAAASG